MATFSDFYKQQMAGLGSSPQPSAAPTVAPAKLDFTPLAKSAAAKASEPQSPINWLIDMLSRPLYGTTNAIQGGIDQGVQAAQEFNAGDTGKGLANVAGATLGILPRFLSGLVNPTNDPNMKRTYSDVIEQSTDKIGHLNPAYQDVQDNVNPILKGVGGFALDVVGDPLTWIPALDIAKVGTAVKGGIDVAKGLVKGTEGTAEVAQGAADIAKAKAADVAVTPSTLPDNPGLDIPMHPEATTPAAGPFPSASTTYTPMSKWAVKGEEKLNQAADVPVKSFSEYLAGHKGAALKSELESITAEVGKKIEVPEKLGDWMKGNLSQKLDISPAAIPGGHTGAVTVGSLAKIVTAERQLARGGELSARGKAAYNFLQGAHIDAQDAASAVKTHVQDVFDARVAENEERMRSIFGDRLMETLANKNTPVAFARTFNRINRVFRPETNLEAFARENKNTIAALRETLDIPDHVGVVANDAEKAAQAAAIHTELTARFGKVVDEITPGTPEHAAKYKYAINGTAFTEGDKATRTGKVLGQFNTYDQYSTVRSMQEPILKEVENLAGGGPAFSKKKAQLYREAYLDTMSKVSELSARGGVTLNIGHGKQELLPLSMDQVYRAVNNHFDDEDKALLALWNQGSSVAFTRLMETVHTALMAGDLTPKKTLQLREVLIAQLKDPYKTGAKGAQKQKLPNNLLKTNAQGFHFASDNAAKAAASKLGGKVVKGSVVFDASKLIPDLADAIIKAQPELVAKVATNRGATVNRMVDEASKLSNDAVSKISNSIDNGVPGSDVMNHVISIGNDITKTAGDIGALQQSAAVAVDIAKMSLGEPLVKEGQILKTLDSDLLHTKVADSIEKSTQRRVDETIDGEFGDPTPFPEGGADFAVKTEKPKIKTPKKDIGTIDEGETLQHVVSKLLPGWVHRTFNLYHGAERTLDLQLAGTARAGMQLGKISRDLHTLARKYPKGDKTLQEAWQALQRGESPAHLSEAQADLMSVMNELLPLKAGSKSYVDLPMLHVDGDVENLNDAMRMSFWQYDSKPEFDVEKATEAAAQATGKKVPSQRDVAEALSQQWRDWNTEDPLDFISRFSAATALVIERRAAMATFVKRFTDEGLVSAKPKPGFVKIVDTTGKSAYAKYLPDKIYVDPTLAGELARLDFLVRTPRHMEGQIGHFVRTYFMPVQNAWKRDITVMRPGHHVRNFIGDSSITWLARGNRAFGSGYQNALKVLGWKNNYSHLDIQNALERSRMGQWELPEGGQTLVSGKVGGKPFQLTTEGAHQAALQYGLLTDYHRSEDLLDNAVEGNNLITKLSKKASFEGTKLGDYAGGVAEFTSHMGRMQHFMQAMEQELAGKGKFRGARTPDELMRKVADEVRRAHPDGSMLTPTESKYFRVAIPFYSWFSKTLPFAIEAAARHPGRLMVFPKASYDAAVAAGVNPDTLSNPFPEDQLFPQFLTGGVFGPQFQTEGGQYINVNPGFAPTDILNTIGQNPIRGVAGMVSPLLRGPAELLSGSQWATGAKINDQSDYIDQNLPFVNYVANVSGVSPTGSLLSVPEGKGLDPQYQVAAGNKTGLDQMLAFANFLTGMNVQNWSRPNFVNYAEIEKRNQAAQGTQP